MWDLFFWFPRKIHIFLTLGAGLALVSFQNYYIILFLFVYLPVGKSFIVVSNMNGLNLRFPIILVLSNATFCMILMTISGVVEQNAKINSCWLQIHLKSYFFTCLNKQI